MIVYTVTTVSIAAGPITRKRGAATMKAEAARKQTRMIAMPSILRGKKHGRFRRSFGVVSIMSADAMNHMIVNQDMTAGSMDGPIRKRIGAASITIKAAAAPPFRQPPGADGPTTPGADARPARILAWKGILRSGVSQREKSAVIGPVKVVRRRVHLPQVEFIIVILTCRIKTIGLKIRRSIVAKRLQ